VGPFGTESILSPQATGIRATVYSATAAELLWDRVPNRALRYEILRDDGLSNTTNGTSYYDNRRLRGRSNTYLVTTIDEEGSRSSPVLIDVPAF
jgi:fibronectin type 3 domain-containing protein